MLSYLRGMVFNATFNNSSVILWQSLVILVYLAPAKFHPRYGVTWITSLSKLYIVCDKIISDLRQVNGFLRVLYTKIMS
jgi:hypothetical protein